MEITSEKNPRIQHILRLREKSRERKKEQLFLIEGVRELHLALSKGIRAKEIFFCTQFIEPVVLKKLNEVSPQANWTEISKNVYEKIALRESTEGVLAVAEMRSHLLSDVKLPRNPLILVVESVEKPGNLGALLRTTDAAGADAVIVCDPQVDIYNPNVIRSSLGCLFSQHIAVCDSDEATQWLKKNSIRIFAATPDAALSCYQADFRQPCALVVGSEAAGLSPHWLGCADAKIVIPMKGVADSLNVSVSAAIILFEAVRQRLPQAI